MSKQTVNPQVSTEVYHSLIETRFGLVAVLWTIHNQKSSIRRIMLPNPGRTALERLRVEFPESEKSTDPGIGKVCEGIREFFAGLDIVFSLDSISLDLCSSFQQAVLRVEHEIPRGTVSTYQRIAARLGMPSAARAVGRALATNPFPIIIPCHRAIRSDRTVGGYQGGTAMKQRLLEMEGISFDDTGEVTGAEYFY
jgi:methylated-DNA-[protein]-cysteine S-methyltransferase